MATLLSLKYSRADSSLEVLDQLEVPHRTVYIPVPDCEAAWSVIRKMQVRGAPLIAIVAALGLAVEAARRLPGGGDEAKTMSACSVQDTCTFLLERMQYLRTSRPTAVNLFKCTDELSAMITKVAAEQGATSVAVLRAYIAAAEAMLDADVAANRAIGRFGAEAILTSVRQKRRAAGTAAGTAAEDEVDDLVTVMTICNTGSLATAGYGTALGVVRALHEMGKLKQVYACETRPYNQGSRLTAFEIVTDGLPGTLICDSMASSCMRSKGVDAVIVGADRVAANGDTANKIGTYQLSIVAKHHGAGFWVAAPSTSCDVHTATGADIEIEERPAQELRVVAGQQVAPGAIAVWNPAFDYAPASLITGIITEHGTLTSKSSDGEAFDVPAFLAAFAPPPPSGRGSQAE